MRCEGLCNAITHSVQIGDVQFQLCSVVLVMQRRGLAGVQLISVIQCESRCNSQCVFSQFIAWDFGWFRDEYNEMFGLRFVLHLRSDSLTSQSGSEHIHDVTTDGYQQRQILPMPTAYALQLNTLTSALAVFVQSTIRYNEPAIPARIDIHVHCISDEYRKVRLCNLNIQTNCCIRWRRVESRLPAVTFSVHVVIIIHQTTSSSLPVYQRTISNVTVYIRKSPRTAWTRCCWTSGQGSQQT